MEDCDCVWLWTSIYKHCETFQALKHANATGGATWLLLARVLCLHEDGLGHRSRNRTLHGSILWEIIRFPPQPFIFLFANFLPYRLFHQSFANSRNTRNRRGRERYRAGFNDPHLSITPHHLHLSSGVVCKLAPNQKIFWMQLPAS